MKRAHLTRVVAGVGTAVGAVILGGLFAACAPGTICDKEGYEAECMVGGSSGGTSSPGAGGSTGGSTGGSGSGTGGTGTPSAMGGTGGGAGGTGGGVKPAPTCKLWTTKEEVAEKLIVMKCGVPGNPACHAMSFPPKFTTAAEAVTVMLDKAPAVYCKQDKLINKADPSKSFIVAKVRAPAATLMCPNGTGSGGAKMPFLPMPALSAEEMDCLEWWAFELSK